MPEGELRVRIPTKLDTVKTLALTDESKMDVAQAIAPTLGHIVAAAGMTLPEAQIAELTHALAERGVITVRPGGAAASATLSVSGSLNYVSRSLPGLAERDIGLNK